MFKLDGGYKLVIRWHQKP